MQLKRTEQYFYFVSASIGLNLLILLEISNEEIADIVNDKTNIAIKAHGFKLIFKSPLITLAISIEVKIDTPINSIDDKINEIAHITNEYDSKNFLDCCLLMPIHLASAISFLVSKM